MKFYDSKNSDFSDTINFYIKNKRNDNYNNSVYTKNGKFFCHYEGLTACILDEEVFKVGCNGNLKKLDKVSTCHAFLSVARLTRIKDILNELIILKLYADVYTIKYNVKKGVIECKESELKKGDLILLDGYRNKALKVVFKD